MRFIAGVAASTAMALGFVSPAVASTNNSTVEESSIRASYGNYDGGFQSCAHWKGIKVRASIKGRAHVYVPNYTVTHGYESTGWRWEYQYANKPGSGDWSVWVVHGEGRVNLTNTKAWCVVFAG